MVGEISLVGYLSVVLVQGWWGVACHLAIKLMVTIEHDPSRQ
jgi:hypothetical protein